MAKNNWGNGGWQAPNRGQAAGGWAPANSNWQGSGRQWQDTDKSAQQADGGESSWGKAPQTGGFGSRKRPEPYRMHQWTPLAAAPAGGSPADIEAEIQDMYSKHNPEKLPELPGILAKYKGAEGKLLSALKSKYELKAGEDAEASMQDEELMAAGNDWKVADGSIDSAQAMDTSDWQEPAVEEQGWPAQEQEEVTQQQEEWTGQQEEEWTGQQKEQPAQQEDWPAQQEAWPKQEKWPAKQEAWPKQTKWQSKWEEWPAQNDKWQSKQGDWQSKQEDKWPSTQGEQWPKQGNQWQSKPEDKWQSKQGGDQWPPKKGGDQWPPKKVDQWPPKQGDQWPPKKEDWHSKQEGWQSRKEDWHSKHEDWQSKKEDWHAEADDGSWQAAQPSSQLQAPEADGKGKGKGKGKSGGSKGEGQGQGTAPVPPPPLPQPLPRPLQNQKRQQRPVSASSEALKPKMPSISGGASAPAEPWQAKGGQPSACIRPLPRPAEPTVGMRPQNPPAPKLLPSRPTPAMSSTAARPLLRPQSAPVPGKDLPRPRAPQWPPPRALVQQLRPQQNPRMIAPTPKQPEVPPEAKPAEDEAAPDVPAGDTEEAPTNDQDLLLEEAKRRVTKYNSSKQREQMITKFVESKQLDERCAWALKLLSPGFLARIVRINLRDGEDHNVTVMSEIASLDPSVEVLAACMVSQSSSEEKPEEAEKDSAWSRQKDEQADSWDIGMDREAMDADYPDKENDFTNEKMREAAPSKEGSLSQVNRALLQEADQCIEDLEAHENLSKPLKAFLKRHTFSPEVELSLQLLPPEHLEALFAGEADIDQELSSQQDINDYMLSLVLQFEPKVEEMLKAWRASERPMGFQTQPPPKPAEASAPTSAPGRAGMPRGCAATVMRPRPPRTPPVSAQPGNMMPGRPASAAPYQPQNERKQRPGGQLRGSAALNFQGKAGAGYGPLRPRPERPAWKAPRGGPIGSS